jgi:hypothetical protein
LISVRSEVQILPGPPRPNDAQRRSCRRGRRNVSCAESGLVQKEAPDKSAAPARHRVSGLEYLAWCFVLRGAALAVARAGAVAAKDFGRRGRPKPWGCSSVGRAPALQAGGHRFDSVHLHQRHERRKASFVSSAAGATLVAPRAPGAEKSTGSARHTIGRSSVLLRAFSARGKVFDL